MRLFEHFYRIIAPDECLNCGTEGSLLCRECATFMLEATPERCYRCYRISPGSRTCQVCRHHSVLKNVWVRTSYTPAARKVIHSLKFKFARDSAKLVAKEIASILPVLHRETIIVHVPAATTHIRQRGFDQSALIAKELSRLLKLPHVHALARIGQQRQVGSSRLLRIKQMKDVFRVVSFVENSHILIIDDVTTTGSTLEAAALTLKNAGAQSVSAACFAQVK